MRAEHRAQEGILVKKKIDVYENKREPKKYSIKRYVFPNCP